MAIDGFDDDDARTWAARRVAEIEHECSESVHSPEAERLPAELRVSTAVLCELSATRQTLGLIAELLGALVDAKTLAALRERST